MSIIAIHQTSKPHEFAREINKLRDGIERDSKLAGQYLATLKAGRPLGLTWEHYLKDCGVKISWQYADKLIAATKPKSPEKSTDEPRQKREPPVENKAEFEEDPDQEDDPGARTPKLFVSAFSTTPTRTNTSAESFEDCAGRYALTTHSGLKLMLLSGA